MGVRSYLAVVEMGNVHIILNGVIEVELVANGGHCVHLEKGEIISCNT